MRALIAERLVLEPASAAQPAHLLPVRAAAHDADAAVPRPRCATRRARRATCRCWWASAVFFPFLRLARRLGGRRGPPLAAVRAGRLAAAHPGVDDGGQRGALPAALGRRARAAARRAATSGAAGRRFALAGLLGVAGGAHPLRRLAGAAADALVGARCSAARRACPVARAWRCVRSARRPLLPAAWLAWSAARGGDRSSSRTTSANDHAGLAAGAQARYGAALGAGCASWGSGRLAFAAAMTPPGLAAGGARARRGVCAPALARRSGRAGRGRSRRRRCTSRRGCCCLSFEPLAALRAGAGDAAAAARRGGGPPSARERRFRAAHAGRRRSPSPSRSGWSPRWGARASGRGAESMGALTRLDAEDRALAAHLRAHRPPHAPS